MQITDTLRHSGNNNKNNNVIKYPRCCAACGVKGELNNIGATAPILARSDKHLTTFKLNIIHCVVWCDDGRRGNRFPFDYERKGIVARKI